MVFKGSEFQSDGESQRVAAPLDLGVLVVIGMVRIDVQKSHMLVFILFDQPYIPDPESREKPDVIGHVQVDMVLGVEEHGEPGVGIDAPSAEDRIGSGKDDFAAAGVIDPFSLG